MRQPSLKGGLQGSPRYLEGSFEAAVAAPQDEAEDRISGVNTRSIRSDRVSIG
ncbi:hypothetical protein MET9862_03712 [Methylobacterium symbioticum]|uniref:Uncharacterized protein n=1 Tax=Methylobacterium symbioticum TaxID=2584084 RepID=A0A509EI15_9HYPH|nr:hypothetical protein MET9862_03712 [Methylobacterium symbioticum]